MAWRTVLISSKAHASVKQGQLLLAREDGDVTIPIEDIAIVILENRQITLSSALLSKLGEAGACVGVCNTSHLPNALMMPFHTHSRIAKIASAQVSWSIPFKKRVWQQIIKQKITNQAHLLSRFDPTQAKPIRAMTSKVDSGDTKNHEAQAARAYWPALMGKGFVRSHDTLSTAALNYGYTIVRACVARGVVGAGLLPCFGVHHQNDLNAFNLVDDLIEPFRPFVDEVVLDIRKGREDNDPLTRDDRAQLLSLASTQVAINGNMQTILNAAQTCSESLVRALNTKDPAQIDLPEFPL